MLKKGVQNILFVKSKKEVTKSLSHDENVTSGSGVRVKASDAVFIEIPTSEYYYKNLFGEYKKIEKGILRIFGRVHPKITLGHII